jgi:hypothetical protein
MRSTGHTLRFGGISMPPSKYNRVTLPDGVSIKQGSYRQLTCSGKYVWKDIIREEKSNVGTLDFFQLFNDAMLRSDYNASWRRRNKQQTKNATVKKRRDIIAITREDF